jgi:hypothetical protein
VTSCGGLRSGKGFIASGAQRGIALGFWGIGFSIFLPPVKVYGLLGYALYASVNAENITDWPPNYPPDINILNPPNGAENVPISTSELTFQIQDFNGALMNYSVTTNPDVGSGSGSSVPDGTYSIPLSGLEGTEEYTWFVQVDDGVNHIDVTSSFTTEAVAPVISNPNPEDGKQFVSVDLSQLSFHLSDPQGDLMEYTVETSPDIGSGSGIDVSEGIYNIDIGGLDFTHEYKWFVNVTDGNNWKHKVFIFQTEPMMVFDPFDEGWNYRKKIIIDYTKVAGDLKNFPVLISTIDSDLRDKAQDDADDVLFMDGPDVANRLFHEIEHYNGSTGELVTWVNVSNLTANQDTEIYIYYGNSECISQQFLEKIWDSNYCGVWHLDNFLDSTMNNNDGTNQGTGDCTGKIDKAKDFISNNEDYIDLGDMSEPCNDLIGTATFEMWIKPDSLTDGMILTKHNSKVEPDKKTYEVEVRTDGKIRFEFWSGTWYPSHKKIIVTTEDSYVSIGIWQHIVAVANVASRDVQIYYNGDKKSSATIIEGDPLPYFYDISWSEHLGRNTGSSTRYYDGCMDEVRISKICRSADWISTEYNNQKDPSSFYQVGPEEANP